MISPRSDTLRACLVPNIRRDAVGILHIPLSTLVLDDKVGKLRTAAYRRETVTHGNNSAYMFSELFNSAPLICSAQLLHYYGWRKGAKWTLGPGRLQREQNQHGMLSDAGRD